MRLLLLLFLAYPSSAASVSFTTKDGWTISAEYHPPQKFRQVVVLIRSAPGSTPGWKYFARQVESLGLGTLSFDLRGYGTDIAGPSGPTTHNNFTKGMWFACVYDVAAALTFLKHAGIADNQVALAGDKIGANVISRAAPFHPHLAWLLLVEPNSSLGALSIGKSGDLATLALASHSDQNSLSTCQKLEQDSVATTCYIAPSGTGVALFKDADLWRKTLAWVKRVTQS